MNPQDPQENVQNNEYLTGDQETNSLNERQMPSHSKVIAPIHNIEIPDAPISASSRQPQQDITEPMPLQTSNQFQSPDDDSSTTATSEPSQDLGGYVDPLSVPTQSSTPSAPIQPQEQTPQLQQVIASTPPSVEAPVVKRSKKPLVIGVIIAIAVLIFGGGGAAYALWYSNPDKALADAVINGIKSETMIAEGSLLVTDSTNKGKITFDFKSQSDNPKLAGSLEGSLKIEYPEFDASLKGAGMIAETGDLYFKVDNAYELLDKALKTEYGAMYAQEPSMEPTLEKVRAFVKKIDGQWIKVEKTYIGEYQKTYEKQQACTKKVLETFYKDSAQQKQVTDLYLKYKFITVKDTGKSEAINGEDSVIYDLKFNAQKANDFGEAVEKTDTAKAIAKCYQAEEEGGVEEYKPSEEEIKDTQETLDKMKTTVWIGRFSHNATKIQFKGSEDSSSYDVHTTLDNETQPNLKAPSSSLDVEDLQKDIEDILNTSGVVNSQEDVSVSTNAGKITSAAYSYMSNNGGKSPTIE